MICIFCEIISGRSPAVVVARNEYCLALIPKDVEVNDHLLVIPVAHYESIFDMPSDLFAKLSDFTKKVCIGLRDEASYSGFNLLHASGVDAEQSVNHFHLHVIPRRKGDNIKAWPKFTGGVSLVKELDLADKDKL